jgi:hypothetical protein
MILFTIFASDFSYRRSQLSEIEGSETGIKPVPLSNFLNKIK